MAGCTRALVAALLAVATSGCVTGHLWQGARRWEQATRFEQASLTGDELLVRYEAAVSDDAGVPLAACERRAAVSLASLRAVSFTADAATVRFVDDPAPPGEPVPISTETPDAPGAPAVLRVHDPRVPIAIPGNVFTRVTRAPWVYPLLPLAFCVDLASMPVLLFFAPGAIVIGD
ncbi:MAG TPA: hypothetical protein VNO26_12605 [Candidatus Limnocylindria bacterium]|nr:hypothetical protein [Candidatus Limnocylindria bacterium]